MGIAFENLESQNCILPINYLTDRYDNQTLRNRVAVVIHLHYSDTFEQYKEYIDRIPQEITLFFTTSNDELSSKIDIYANSRENCRMIRKNNRGRDISSFLVACREEILNYEYICFLHDKKEKDPEMKADTDNWVYSQWENMLGSTTYICNILAYFEKHKQVGVLLPPIPVSERLSFAYRNNWFNNYENTIKLAGCLNLNCDINKEISPMALGTVYWARVSALRKLFEHKWKYEDFDAEPLADDGTLSHAVERILEYVAKDAGYESKWVMTDRYAEERLGYFTSALSKAFERLRSSLGLRYICDLNQFDARSLELKKMYQSYKKVYIYGAGLLGKDCLHFMKFIGIKVEAFIVSEMNRNELVIESIPVYPFNEIEFDNQTLVIIAANQKYQENIFGNLKKKQLPASALYNWCAY